MNAPVTPEFNEVSAIMHKAAELAIKNRHESISRPHVMVAMAQTPALRALMVQLRIDPIEFESEMQTLLMGVPPASVPVQTLYPTSVVSQALNVAMGRAAAAGRPEVLMTDLLMAIYDDASSGMAHTLNQFGVSRFQLQKAIAHGPDPSAAGEANKSALETYAVNLNQMVGKGKGDLLIGRDDEIRRTVQVLCRRRKNNPLYIGEPGVGKTALAEGLAQRIESGNVPEPLRKAKLWMLNMASLLAGTKYRGDFEERLKKIVEEAKADPNIFLVIDEIHTVVGAGASSGSAMDAGNLLKPALASGDLRVIGATTYEEYRKFEKDKALARRFQTIDVLEPTPEQTLTILQGVQGNYAKHHGVTYTPEALAAAVKLSVRHLPQRLLPDKALDVIDEAGSWQRVAEPDVRVATITEKEIASTVARLARIPENQLDGQDRNQVRDLEGMMKSRVFGQDLAIEELVEAVKLARAGLSSTTRTQGAFLFAGPTGVGKTEVSRQLAQNLGLPLLRFDMSEYAEAHSVARLIGAPAGYVGHDNGGVLTEAAQKNPSAVLLLDEIEKAHPDIYNLLLQIMDNATLTDSQGRVARFDQMIVIMTSNAGASMAARPSMGFLAQNHQSDASQTIQKMFSPEFRNRLDAVVQFQPLELTHIRQVVDKALVDLEATLLGKKVALDVSPEARDWLAKGGFDPVMGARPLERYISRQLKRRLVDDLLHGKLVNGGQVQVTLVNDALDIQIAPLDLEPPVNPRSRRRMSA